MPDIESNQQGGETKKLSGMNDEELVSLARSGNRYAAELIFNRYKDFVKLRSHSFYLAGADHEDVMQEGMIGLYKAILSFEPEKGASFKTFAELCISRQIMSAVKTATRKKHIPLNTYVSIDRKTSDSDGTEVLDFPAEKTESDPEQIIIDRERMDGIHGQIDKVLSRFEAEVLMHHLNGISYTEIAELLGREPKAVDNALQRIKKKLEKFLIG